MLILLAWQLFRQQYHQGDARLIRWTQTSLMFFILTLSLTSSSIQAYLANNLQQMLGSDLVISQHQALTGAQLDKLQQHAQDGDDRRAYADRPLQQDDQGDNHGNESDQQVR